MEKLDLLEVRLKKSSDFLKVKETLTRIGIPNEKTKTLYQTAHILHKGGKYYIVHFKEMFILDKRVSTIDSSDRARRTAIALLLDEWGLVELVKPIEKQLYEETISTLKIIPFIQKHKWNLVEKYRIGKKF